MTDSSTTQDPSSNWKPDELDRFVLGMLYETGFMQEPHIRNLYGLAKASVNVRINRLLAENLIERRKPASDKPKPQVPFIYQLTLASYRYVPRIAGGHLRRHKPLAEQQLHPGTTAHKLAVADLAISVAAALASFLPTEQALDWWGEHRSQMRLAIDARHPKSESLVQPDGAIRVLAAGSTTWRERHQAPATSAWWVEVDRGTEDQRKWVAKVARYSRAIRAQAWRGVLGDIPLPGLLVTVAGQGDDQDGDMVAVALGISHAAAVAGLPQEWIIWIAQHRALVQPGDLAAPLWRQVQIHSNTTAENVLFGAAWSLPAILAPEGRLYPLQAWREERWREEEDRLKAAAARAAQEKCEREQQEQERRERERQAHQAAQQQVKPPAPAAVPTLPLAPAPVAPRTAEPGPARAEDEGGRRRMATPASQRYAPEVQPLATQQSQQPSTRRPKQSRAQRPEYSVTSYDEEERKKRDRRLLTSLISLFVWLNLYFAVHPTFVEIADSHAHDYRSLPDHLTDYIFCPQLLLVLVPALLILLFLRFRWEERYYHGL